MNNHEKLNVLLQNAKLLKERENMAKEQRRIMLSSVATELCSTGKNNSIESIVTAFSLCDPSPEEKILLYSEISRYPKLAQEIKDSFPLGSRERVTAGSHSKIAYVKNDINSYAYNFFCEKIANAKPTPVSSFSSACESVWEGESEFCILPVENAAGKLLGFYSTIERYELKIRMVCNIDEEDAQPVKYALLSRSCKWITEKAKKQNFTFEFFILAENTDFLGDIIKASAACEAEFNGLDFMPVEYDSGLKRYLFSFNVSGYNVLPFHTFMSLNYETYVPLGFFNYNLN